MATVPYVINNPRATDGNNAGSQVVWGPMQNGDIGQAIAFSDFADFSLQVEGVPGAGFAFQMEGSNDKLNFRVLTDPQGVPIQLTSAGVIKQVTEATLQQRPHVTLGDGTTSGTVSAFYRRSPPPGSGGAGDF